MFSDEATLVECFVKNLENLPSPWGKIKSRTEFFYSRGRTDVIAASEDGKVIAFEAKLKNWKIALQQAYKNRCFANLSYVILPASVAVNAARYLGEFVRRGVGLCYINDDVLVIQHEASESSPLQPWLHEQALNYVYKP